MIGFFNFKFKNFDLELRAKPNEMEGVGF